MKDKCMKILIIAPTPFFADRGTHIRILEEALALEKLGHSLTIVTYSLGKGIQGKTNIKIERIFPWLFWYNKLEAGPDWQKVLLDLILIGKSLLVARREKPDIIHAHLHEGVLIGWLIKNILFWRKIKLVADFHGSLVNEMISHGYLSNGILKKFFSFLEKIICQMGAVAIASSSENAKMISAIRKGNEVEVVLDGVNLDVYSQKTDKEQIKKEFGIPVDKKIAIYAGGLVPNKGINYLLGAIKEITAKNSEIHFVIAGYPYEYTKKYLEENNLFSRVTLISPLSYFDLPRILRAGDIGIDPKDSSIGQASGKILQYMAAGLPVVCFDRENNRKYLGGGGYYVSDISVLGIARGILDLSKNEIDCKAKGEINKERVVDFSWEKSGLKIDAIYRKIT